MPSSSNGASGSAPASEHSAAVTLEILRTTHALKDVTVPAFAGSWDGKIVAQATSSTRRRAIDSGWLTI